MTRPLVFVKLGGSILTNKSARGPPRFLRQRAQRLMREVQHVHRTHDLLLVLGAGSWGHPQALAHGVGRRTLRGTKLRRAAEEIRASVGALRSHVADVALRHDLPVVPVAASSLAQPSKQRSLLRHEVLAWILQARLVPLTGGDVVADPHRGLRILSGDEILASLVRPLRPDRVIFATDVPGVLVDGKVRRELRRRDLDSILPQVDVGRDATGGMRGKLEQALRIVDAGTEVQIVDGRKEGEIARALRGRPVGTRLVA